MRLKIQIHFSKWIDTIRSKYKYNPTIFSKRSRAVNIKWNIMVQCPPLNRIIGQHKSDNNNWMIQWTDVFCVLLMYNGISNTWLQYADDYIIHDPKKAAGTLKHLNSKEEFLYQLSTLLILIMKMKILLKCRWLL